MNARTTIAQTEHVAVFQAPPSNTIPTTLSIAAEQMTAVESLLKAFEYDVPTLLRLHGHMRSIGGWTTASHRVLNSLLVTDIEGIFSDDCKVDVRPPRPVTLEANPNGYPLTDGQVKTLEDWFARPENLQYDREDLLRIVRTSGYPADLFVIHAASPQELAVILYAGYKPLSRPDAHAGMNT